MDMQGWTGDADSVAQQQRVAAGPAGLAIAAREHIGDAVLKPLVARQMLDHDRARPQRLRSISEKADEDTVLETFDVDLQRIDFHDACVRSEERRVGKECRQRWSRWDDR